MILTTWEESPDDLAALKKLKVLLQPGNPVPFAKSMVPVLVKCLHSHQPQSVQQAALDVFTTALGLVIESDPGHTLPIWINGLASALSYRSSIKPALIALLQDQILPLPNLRSSTLPLMRALILELELDETTLPLLTTLYKRNTILLWQCYALIVIKSPECRPGALIWASNNTADLANSNSTYLVAALTLALTDENPSIRRGFFDIAISHIPLSCPLFTTATSSDLASFIINLIFSTEENLPIKAWLFPKPPSALLDLLIKLPTDLSGAIKLGKIACWMADVPEACTSILPHIIVPLIRFMQSTDEARRLLQSATCIWEAADAHNTWNALVQAELSTILFAIRTFDVKQQGVIDALAKLLLRPEPQETLKLLLVELLPCFPKNADISPLVELVVTALSTGKGALSLLSQAIKTLKPSTWRNERIACALQALNSQTQYSIEFVLGLTDLALVLLPGLKPREADCLIQTLVKLIWNHLTCVPDYSDAKAVNALWDLQRQLPNRQIEAAVSSLFLDMDLGLHQKARALYRIWSLSEHPEEILTRPLFLILEKVQDQEPTPESLIAQRWLEAVLATGPTHKQKLMDMATQPLITIECLNRKDLKFDSEDDLNVYTYYAKIVLTLLKADPSLAVISTSDSYGSQLKTLVLRFLSFETPKFDQEVYSSFIDALAISLQLLHLLTGPTDKEVLQAIYSLTEFLQRGKIDPLSEIRILDLLSRFLQLPYLFHEDALSATLLQCVIQGLSSSSELYVVEAWTSVLNDSLHIWRNDIVQYLNPLCRCLCDQVKLSFSKIQLAYNHAESEHLSPSILFAYIRALDKLLAASHSQLSEYLKSLTDAASDDIAGSSSFFGSVIAGVFTVESPQTRSTALTKRIEMLTSFSSVLREAYGIWTWVESTAPVAPGYARLKFWTRKLMASLYKLETLETLEALISLGKSSPHIFKVLHGLDGSKPKLTIQCLFLSVISRTNPLSLEVSQRSTFTTDLPDTDFMAFLVRFLKSLDSDAIEEIWAECVGFLREVQANHTMYRHLLPDVFRFMSVMANKADSVKFGEQRKIRRELADAFVKILSLSLSARNIISSSTPPELVTPVQDRMFVLDPSGAYTDLIDNDSPVAITPGKIAQDALPLALEEVISSLHVILWEDSDKELTSLTTIISTLSSPAAKAKNFPGSFTSELILLLKTVMATRGSDKAWKPLVGDLVLDQRFLAMSPNQAQTWKPIVRRWAQVDKERVQDYTNRLLTHGSNSNVLFNWSDSETTNQRVNLTRLAYIFLCGPSDGYLLNINEIVNILEAMLPTEPTVPSVESVHAEVFTCLRAIILNVEPRHLVSIWTFVRTELEKAFNVLLERPRQMTQEELRTLVSACKLLDQLLVMGLEDFKPYEWLFICDNMEAIMKNSDDRPAGIIDKIAMSGVLTLTSEDVSLFQQKWFLFCLLTSLQAMSLASVDRDDDTGPKLRRPFLLNPGPINLLSQLKPFFEHLAIYAFEAQYSLANIDLEACEEEIMRDLFLK